MDDVDVPRDLAAIEQPCGASLDLMRTSFFLGRQKLVASRDVAGMALWREHLFAWMLKTSPMRSPILLLSAGQKACG